MCFCSIHQRKTSLSRRGHSRQSTPADSTAPGRPNSRCRASPPRPTRRIPTLQPLRSRSRPAAALAAGTRDNIGHEPRNLAARAPAWSPSTRCYRRDDAGTRGRLRSLDIPKPAVAKTDADIAQEPLIRRLTLAEANLSQRPSHPVRQQYRARRKNNLHATPLASDTITTRA